MLVITYLVQIENICYYMQKKKVNFYHHQFSYLGKRNQTNLPNGFRFCGTNWGHTRLICDIKRRGGSHI